MTLTTGQSRDTAMTAAAATVAVNTVNSAILSSQLFINCLQRILLLKREVTGFFRQTLIHICWPEGTQLKRQDATLPHSAVEGCLTL
jgi:hypothetical protein